LNFNFLIALIFAVSFALAAAVQVAEANPETADLTVFRQTKSAWPTT
jgi:hypothetical protein